MVFACWCKITKELDTVVEAIDLISNQSYLFNKTEEFKVGTTGIAVGELQQDNKSFIVKLFEPNAILTPLAEKDVYKAAAAYLSNDPKLEEFDNLYNECTEEIT